MSISRSHPHLFLSLLFSFLLAPIPALGQRMHPRLKQAKPADDNPVISRLVILRTQVSFVKAGMEGNEPQEKEAAAATPVIEKALAKALTSNNLTVLDSPFAAEKLQNDEKLKYAL